MHFNANSFFVSAVFSNTFFQDRKLVSVAGMHYANLISEMNGGKVFSLLVSVAATANVGGFEPPCTTW
jgi:hypothetical protein